MIREMLDQALITDRGNAVLDPLRTQAGQCLPNALRSGGLTGVRDAA